MSILKEPKSLDDRSIKEDTAFEKWEDRFPTDKYRTFATHVPMFDFTTKTSSLEQWKVNDFSKWFKDPKGLPVAPNEKVPLTHYKLGINEPAKEEKDVFGNNIINNQKDIKADYMNRVLPEKYTYGLDRKGQGDLAYEQLDIEYGDTNELSRARDEFFEQYYLQQNHGIDVNNIKNDISKIESEIKQGQGSERKIRQLEENERILVEEVPDIMGKIKDPRIPMEEIGMVYGNLKSNRDRPLSQRELNGVNRLLMRLDGKRIPVGTYAYAAADKIEEAFKKQNPKADWSFGSEYRQLTNDMAGKIQRNVRRHAVKKQVDNAKREKHERAVNFENEPGYASSFDNSPLPGHRRGRRRTPLNRSASSSDVSVASNASAINEEPFGLSPRSVKNTPKRKPRRQSRQLFASPRPVDNLSDEDSAGGGRLRQPLVAEPKQPSPLPLPKPRSKPFTSISSTPAGAKSRPLSPIMPTREEITAGGGGAGGGAGAKEEKKIESRTAATTTGSNPDYIVGDTAQIRSYDKAIDLITTTYEMSMATARAEGATYPITAQFRQEISKLLGTHSFNATTKNIKQIADWMKKNKPRSTEIETRSKTSPRGDETRPASSTRK